jgi:hypothetical protein
MKMKSIVRLGFLMISSFVLVVQLAAQRKYSNEFLNLGAGAKAMGMGNAQVSLVNDATAGYWNPAGLLHSKNKYEVALMHSEYFAGIAKYDYGAITTKLDSNSAAGLSVIRFGVDNIPNTTELIDANGNWDYGRIKNFSSYDLAVILSYARTLKALPGVKLGSNFKIVRRKIGDFGGAWGFGLDLGAQYEYKKWQLGAMVNDITTTVNAWSYSIDEKTKQTFIATGNSIPSNASEITLPKLRLGVSRQFLVWKNKLSLQPALDLITTFDGKRNVLLKSNFASVEPVIGFEAAYKQFLYVRLGANNIQEITNEKNKKVTSVQPNIGLGIKYRIFTLDYALTNAGDVSDGLYSNVFSLKIDIPSSAASKLSKN